LVNQLHDRIIKREDWWFLLREEVAQKIDDDSVWIGLGQEFCRQINDKIKVQINIGINIYQGSVCLDKQTIK